MDADPSTPRHVRATPAPALTVSVDARAWAGPARGLGRWLAGIAPKRARGTVDILLVGDARMRRLNRDWRGVDKATDVLSFPADDGDMPMVTRRGGPPRHLGDIVIAAGVAQRQAADAGHSFSRELRVLALHGLLHLLGYDHETDTGQMARLERRLRRAGGLTAGLIERGQRA